MDNRQKLLERIAQLEKQNAELTALLLKHGILPFSTNTGQEHDDASSSVEHAAEAASITKQSSMTESYASSIQPLHGAAIHGCSLYGEK